MKGRLGLIVSLLLVTIIMSGCLVQDDSKTLMGKQEKSEVKDKAQEITTNFFDYNSYDSTADNSYSAQDLIDLFNPDASLKILSMRGIPTEKALEELKGELYEKEALFAAFEAQLDNNKFKYSSYKLTFDYKIVFSDNDIDEYTAAYMVKFQVFEEINGEKISTPAGVPDGVTDNGTIKVHLYNGNQGWKIEWMEINFQELGSVSLN